MLGGQTLDQSFALGDVTGLPRREDNPHWVAQGFDDFMIFVVRAPRERPIA
jgi:hypothetical protein